MEPLAAPDNQGSSARPSRRNASNGTTSFPFAERDPGPLRDGVQFIFNTSRAGELRPLLRRAWPEDSFSIRSHPPQEKKISPPRQALLRWYRPPMGHMNWELVRAIGECGIATAIWTVNTRDWEIGPTYSVESSLNSTMALMHPGAVVLLHDRRPDTLELLPLLLDRLKGEGYTRFLTMTQWYDEVIRIANALVG